MASHHHGKINFLNEKNSILQQALSMKNLDTLNFSIDETNACFKMCNKKTKINKYVIHWSLLIKVKKCILHQLED